MAERVDESVQSVMNAGRSAVPVAGPDQRPPAIFLIGPTASGKTALACWLAERFPLQLISVDSALVYRGMDIGTAKPDAETLTRFPHRLIDIRDPTEPYSAAQFRIDALDEMARIRAAGQVPLLVGGTNLYFRALEVGMSELPQADESLRAQIADEAATLGWPQLHQRLAAADPLAASRIRPGDTQRIGRALEVIALTGRPLSDQQLGRRERLPWRVLKLALFPEDRAALHARIGQRLDAMLDAGFLDEVRRLRALPGIHADLPSVRCVGYRQAWEHLDGITDAEEFRQHALFATRQLAKRQMTWLRADLDTRRFDPDRAGFTETAARACAAFLQAR